MRRSVRPHTRERERDASLVGAEALGHSLLPGRAENVSLVRCYTRLFEWEKSYEDAVAPGMEGDGGWPVYGLWGVGGGASFLHRGRDPDLRETSGKINIHPLIFTNPADGHY